MLSCHMQRAKRENIHSARYSHYGYSSLSGEELQQPFPIRTIPDDEYFVLIGRQVGAHKPLTRRRYEVAICLYVHLHELDGRWCGDVPMRFTVRLERRGRRDTSLVQVQQV